MLLNKGIEPSDLNEFSRKIQKYERKFTELTLTFCNLRYIMMTLRFINYGRINIMGIQVKRVKRTRTEGALKAALLTILKDKPVRRVTIKELCEAANIYRSTFYCHYENVESLLTAIEDDVIAEIDKSMELFVADELTTYEYARRLCDYVKSGKYDFSVLLHESTPESSAFRAKVVTRLADQFRALHPELDDYKKEYIPIAAAGGAVTAVLTWFESGCALPLDDLTRAVHDSTKAALRG